MIIIIILPKIVNTKQNAILSLVWCRGAGNIFGANRNRTDENTRKIDRCSSKVLVENAAV